MNDNTTQAAGQEQRLRRILIGTGIAAVIAVAGVLLGYSVYVARSDSPLVVRVGGVLPVAQIGSQTVTYAQFISTRNALRTYLASQSATQDGLAQPFTPALEEKSFESLLQTAAIADLSATNKIVVSNDDLNKAFADVVASTSTTHPDANAYIRATFGWTESEFQTYFLKPQIEASRLIQTLTTSTDPLDQDAALSAAIGDRLARPDVHRYLKIQTPTQAPTTQPQPTK